MGFTYYCEDPSFILLALGQSIFLNKYLCHKDRERPPVTPIRIPPRSSSVYYEQEADEWVFISAIKLIGVHLIRDFIADFEHLVKQ